MDKNSKKLHVLSIYLYLQSICQSLSLRTDAEISSGILALER